MADLAKRFPANPILHPADIRPSIPGMKVECLLNPGVFRFDGKTWLLLRVAERPEQKPGQISFPILTADGMEILEFDESDPALDLSDPRIIRHEGRDYLTTLSHLRLVSSEDGIRFVGENAYPSIFGQGELESYGLEDCRVSQIAEVYYLTCTAVSPFGVGVALRSTEDWRSFVSHGLIFPPHNKDCALFDEKIGGKYFALHRPSSVQLGGNYIWLAESRDLLHWGGHRCIATTRPGAWDGARVGAGAAPIRTEEGWLEIYHGADADHRLLPRGALAGSQRALESPRPFEGTGHGTGRGLRADRLFRQRRIHQRPRGGRRPDHALLRRFGQRHLRGGAVHLRGSRQPPIIELSVPARPDTMRPHLMSTNIESHLQEKRVFKPSKAFSKKAWIGSREQYEKRYRESIERPEKFWARRRRS